MISCPRLSEPVIGGSSVIMTCLLLLDLVACHDLDEMMIGWILFFHIAAVYYAALADGVLAASWVRQW